MASEDNTETEDSRVQVYQEDDDESGSEMTFLEHLEELRWRLIYSIIGIAAGTLICWIFIDFIVEKILLTPRY